MLTTWTPAWLVGRGLVPPFYKFTGKERDGESGLDHCEARYYANNFGRFMQTDWAATAVAIPYAHYGNPQSLNLYAYVENNPATLGSGRALLRSGE